LLEQIEKVEIEKDKQQSENFFESKEKIKFSLQPGQMTQ